VNSNYNITTGSKQGIIIFEGVYTDPDGKTPYKGQFEKILEKFL
jgi:hypothetical protein